MTFEHPQFSVERQEIAAGEARREVVAIYTGNWVNVVPLRDEGQVVLIRQWRFGIAAPAPASGVADRASEGLGNRAFVLSRRFPACTL